jgi:hypothetical protein
MPRKFPSRLLTSFGLVVLLLAWALAAELASEQTFLSWNRGPQMVGFSLAHGPGIFLIFGTLAGLIWVIAALFAMLVTRSFGGKIMLVELVAYALAWVVILAPYGFWQRLFIWKFTPTQAADFFTYAAATGDQKTVKAFLARGVPINTQTRNGTALHGAAVEGDLEMIEYLIQQGADVNAINAYGDSPLANAMGARSRAQETQALLIKHGAKLVRGTEEQRNRLIEEQVHQDIEEEHRRNQSK